MSPVDPKKVDDDGGEKSTLLENKNDIINKKEESQSSSKRNVNKENNNGEGGETSSKGKMGDKKENNTPPPTFKTKYFPWIVCATSFIVQFFVLGFYKSFGPVYVKLLQPEPEGYGGSPVATCKILFSLSTLHYLHVVIIFACIFMSFNPRILFVFQSVKVITSPLQLNIINVQE